MATVLFFLYFIHIEVKQKNYREKIANLENKIARTHSVYLKNHYVDQANNLPFPNPNRLFMPPGFLLSAIASSWLAVNLIISYIRSSEATTVKQILFLLKKESNYFKITHKTSNLFELETPTKDALAQLYLDIFKMFIPHKVVAAYGNLVLVLLILNTSVKSAYLKLHKFLLHIEERKEKLKELLLNIQSKFIMTNKARWTIRVLRKDKDKFGIFFSFSFYRKESGQAFLIQKEIQKGAMNTFIKGDVFLCEFKIKLLHVLKK